MIDLGVVMLVINTCNEMDLMTICLVGSGHLWTFLTFPSTVVPPPPPAVTPPFPLGTLTII